MRKAFVVVVAGVLWLAPAFGAAAHEQRAVGPLRLTVGWLEEPAYAGERNGISVEVTRGGTPIEDAELSAVVIFGGRDARTRSERMRMRSQVPGLYTAPLLPSQPGTYTFHLTGEAGDDEVDEYFTSGSGTFDDVRDPAADSFPVRVASTSDLAKRIDRAEERAASDARRARTATALAGGALALAVVALARGRRRG